MEDSRAKANRARTMAVHTSHTFDRPPFLMDNEPSSSSFGSEADYLTFIDASSWPHASTKATFSMDTSNFLLSHNPQQRPPFYPTQQSQPPMMQRFNDELFSGPFSNGPFHGGGNISTAHSYPPVPYLPHTAQMASPSLSHGLTHSDSAPSPDPEFYGEMALSRPSEDWPGRNLQEVFGGRGGDYHFVPAGQHVNMSQIQVQTPEFRYPDNLFYEQDEEVVLQGEGVKSEFVMEERRGMQAYYTPESSHHASMHEHEHASPHTAIHEEDIDADGSMDIDLNDADLSLPGTPASDTSYTPTSRARPRRKPRPSATRNSITAPKRTPQSRITKPPHTSKSRTSIHTCKSCTHAPFPSASSLSKHNATSHSRNYVCVFAFAGCWSTFGSKNEWKRHVYTQHLQLESWVCENCVLPSASKPTRSSPSSASARAGTEKVSQEFNRKDLFTSHLRRMHVPPSLLSALKTQKSPLPANHTEVVKWEKEIKSLQDSALRQKRAPPLKLSCPVQGCEKVFVGKNAWGERMECVGRHLEKDKRGGGVVVEDGKDREMVRWAVQTGICKVDESGGVILVEGGGGKGGGVVVKVEDVDVGGEEDAEGEVDEEG